MNCKDIRRNKSWVNAAVAPAVLALALAFPSVAAAQQPQPEPQQEPVAEPAEPQVQPPVTVQHPTPPPRGIVQEGAWTLSPMLGAGLFADTDNGVALGLGAAYNWTPRVSFEGELGYTRTSIGVAQPLNANLTTASVNALYHLSAGNVAPYGTVGIGIGHANRGANPFTDVQLADANRTSAMFNWGGGLKAPVGERVNLRVGVRHFSGHDLVPNYWRPYVGLTFNLGPTW
jgi:opacity protein-like surface antigen